MSTPPDRASAGRVSSASDLASPALAASTTELKRRVEAHFAALDAMVQPDDPQSGGEDLGRAHAREMDALLLALFSAARARLAPSSWWRKSRSVALAAVGSYGRGAVALRSDLDVRFLCDGPRDQLQPLADAILYPLWDSGLTVGHQIVSPSDVLPLARSDLPTATSLLDWRFLAGDEPLSGALVHAARSGLFSDDAVDVFVQRLADEVVARHARFGGSVYLLEPDVRNGAGGLRDLDVALWAARARWNVADLADLVRVGVLVQREAQTIADARSFFWRVRNRLHLHAGRRSDRLTFDLQEDLCAQLGYGDGGAAVESMMSDYYRHARAVSRAREVIFHRAATPPRKRLREEDLGSGLKLFDGQLSLAEPAQLTDDPALALRLFLAAVERNVPVYPYARDAVARASVEPAWCEALRSSSEAARLFVQLCITARETRLVRHSALAELHDVGLLVAMVPEFAPVVGRVHHDVYHVYTVDVHSVAAVDRLRALVRGDLIAEFPLACRLAAEISSPTVLYISTLLHDVGKAIGGRDHATRGADMSRDICARLGLGSDDTEQIAHLIEQHLVMYHLATRRDLDDPATIEEFARAVREPEGLRELYLLTVADISTTSPTAMTSWKARMLDDLFHAADALLSGTAHASTHDRRLRHVEDEVLARTAYPALARLFLEGMPERYLLSSAPGSIAAHLEIARSAGPDGLALDFLPLRQGDALELCIVAPDRPGLLAMFAAAITANRLEIQAAQIHSRVGHAIGSVSASEVPASVGPGSGPGSPADSDPSTASPRSSAASESGAHAEPQAVDVFWVRGPGAEPEELLRTRARLTSDIAAMLEGRVRPASLLEGRARPSWSVRPLPAVREEVIVDERASSRQTVIEVITRDRPGLVFALARAVHDLGLTITLAKINTEGTRVADVFYVTEANGTKLESPRAMAVRDALMATLQTME